MARFRPRTTTIVRSTESVESRCQRVLAYIDSHIDTHDYSPTMRQIQRACDIRSLDTVHSTVTMLEHAGFIRRDPVITRRMRVVRDDAL